MAAIKDRENRARIPWYLWCAALAVTSAYVGGYWDISWHRSIGRDSFWSAPHMAIYACGILAGISAGYLIFSTTFGSERRIARTSASGSGDCAGPLGAFISAWGGVAMLASAPFDDWWHNAYGLDVRIISPPHMVLAAGFFGIEFGTVMLMLAFMNRAQRRMRPAAAAAVPLRRRHGVVRVAADQARIDQPRRSTQRALLLRGRDRHAGDPGRVVDRVRPQVGEHDHGRRLQRVCAGVSVDPAAVSGGAEARTGVSRGHALHPVGIPAAARRAGVRHGSDHPAHRGAGGRWSARFVVGLAFFAAFVAVQWPFADFMMSPCGPQLVLRQPLPGLRDAATIAAGPLRVLLPRADPLLFWRGMLIAGLIAWLMAWLGMHAGRAMQKVRR